MDTEAVERLDSFPFRHRALELMSTPPLTVAPTGTIADAVRLMSAKGSSSVIALDGAGRLAGILTERDVLRLIADDPRRLSETVSSVMSAPVHGIEADALVYRALARMARLGVRHLPVVDEHDRPIGMLTTGSLLKQRASLALTLGDEIACAADGGALREVHDKLPGLVHALRREDVSATQASAVIAGITRDLTARAGELALADMVSAGRGEAPAPWCLLVLGSAGRGETLLAPDQDNALIHEGRGGDDAWFARFGERLNVLLDEAGVPFCKGGVMVGNAAYRHSLDAWKAQVDAWIARPQPEALLGVDIFYDFVAVLGERRLAGALRTHATRAAGRSPPFLRLLAAAGEDVPSATDLLGRLRTHEGRIDLKLFGLRPIVEGARAAALAWGCTVTGTDQRLIEAASRGAFPHDAAKSLIEARGVIVDAILDQQLTDVAAQRQPDNRVDPRRLDRAATARLRAALAMAAGMPEQVHEALANRPLVPPASRG
jgi:signal-transduction protein with cAMP-binding, CBS, and nucleotidyltransferase domain